MGWIETLVDTFPSWKGNEQTEVAATRILRDEVSISRIKKGEYFIHCKRYWFIKIGVSEKRDRIIY